MFLADPLFLSHIYIKVNRLFTPVKIDYTDLCTGCSIKNQLIASFGEQFKKSHENRKIIFQSHVSDLDQKIF